MKYDVIILGAGINGVALARECAQQGKSVMVIDKKTIGCGASSHSSRLIHGGLRYLETYEFGLVYESLSERAKLVEAYPDLVKMHPFLVPVYTNSPRPSFIIRIGLFLYDLLSGFKAKHKKVTKTYLDKFHPALLQTNLTGAYTYFDAKTNDLKLTQIVANEAKEAGAVFKENILPKNIMINNENITITLEDETVETTTLINATGAWVDETNEKYGLPSNFTIQKVSGIHIVIDGLLVKEPVLLQAAANRVFFVIPEDDTQHTIIGTTERLETGLSDDVVVNQEDVNYLLDSVNVYLKKPLTNEDIIQSYIGIRPLVASKKSINKASREYELDLLTQGNTKLMHVFGGKLTTHAALARKGFKKLFN